MRRLYVLYYSVLLEMDETQSVEKLLVDLASQDNDIRSNAESNLTCVWLKTKPHILLSSLVHLLTTHPDADVCFGSLFF